MLVKDKVQIELDGVRYEVQLLSTSSSFTTGQELVTLIAPSLGAAADGFFSSNPDESKMTFAEVAILLIGQMGDVDILNIIKLQLAGATADGILIDFETHFRGNLGQLVNLLEFTMKENYSGLFTQTSLGRELQKFMKGWQEQTQLLEEHMKEQQES